MTSRYQLCLEAVADVLDSALAKDEPVDWPKVAGALRDIVRAVLQMESTNDG